MSAVQPPDPTAAPVRVLVVDDHPLFRDGIRERLESGDDSIVVIGEASDGAQAGRLVTQLQPDVVLMDIAMPDVNGIEATRRIHGEHPDVAVIILSVYDDDQYVHAAITAGARGYLLKTVEAPELRDSVMRVSRGETALSPDVARTVLSLVAHPQPDAPRLSERELQVLRLAAHGASNKAIGSALFLSTRTVEAHMRSIFDKLGVSSRTEAVTYAVRHQWIQLSDDD
ncbi:MAG: response regulator transcription factor [Actinobacteria bacterium]|nr:response regulator transcription factor [Actinomycetota bacterium]